MPSVEMIKKTMPSTTSLEGGYGGIPEYEACDIAAALAYGDLSDGASLYCQYRHQHQQGMEEMVWKFVYFNYCNEWFIKEMWVAKGATVFRMAEVALREVISNSLCPLCSGTGVSHETGSECGKCRGSGYKRPSNRSLARQLGIDKDQYYVWATRYNRTLMIFYGYEDEIARAINKLGE